jgi:capsular polysaccharide biosynthesis protein
VEANEVMLRIVWRHRWLLVITTLLPMAVVLPLRLIQPVTYTATANVQAQVAAPQASTEVTSILSQVSAIATSPAVVQKAIDAAKVDRNAVEVAKTEISSTSLDSSAIVAVTVKDANRQVALRLSQTLASAIVGALNAPGTAASQQLATLVHEETQLNAYRSSLLTQLNTAQLSHLSSTDPQVQALVTELAGVEAQLSANQAAQQQEISNSNGNQDASVISEPSAATVTAASKQVAVYVALAGLLGLIVGLLIATIVELARPTVAEPEAGARELGVAFLGNAEMTRARSTKANGTKANGTGGDLAEEVSTEGELTEEELIALEGDLVTRLHLAANRLGALTLVLTGPIPREQLTQLAAALNRRLSAADDLRVLETRLVPDGEAERNWSAGRNGNGNKAHGPAAVKTHALAIGSALSTLKVHALSDLTLRGRPEAPAVVLVLRRFAPRASLDRVADLGETTGWPILGVMGLRQKRKPHRHWLGSEPSVVESTTADEVPVPTTVPAATQAFRVVKAAKTMLAARQLAPQGYAQ